MTNILSIDTVVSGATYYVALRDSQGNETLVPLTIVDSSSVGGTPSQWYEGHGAPSSDSIGNNGDFYLDVDSGDVWEKSGGTWGASSSGGGAYSRVIINVGDTSTVAIDNSTIADYASWQQGSQVNGKQWTFTLANDATVVLTMTGSPDGDTVMRLLHNYDIDMVNHTFDLGTLIAENDDNTPPGGGGSQITQSLTAGTYVVEGTFFRSSGGNITLNIATQ